MENLHLSLAKPLRWCIICNMSKDIEKKLRDAIIKSKMSRYRISRLSGVSEAQLSLFVNNKRTLTLTSAAKVAKVLGLELKP
jgi:transcriptional regulator with XRE-family HTH domain